MKRVALIGHRGVGKTSLLKRIARVEPFGLFFDLDAEIERRSGETIQSLFAKGEPAFRAAERETFVTINDETRSSTKSVYIAMGAGFDPSLIGDDWDVWWIRRGTDASGRIFTDRPRLNHQTSALGEYLERYTLRHQRYASRADQILWLDEGSEDVEDPAEHAYLNGQLKAAGGTLTLLPDAFRRDVGTWLKKRLAWGFGRIELRDDLLSPDQMRDACERLAPEKTLISFRNPERQPLTRELIKQRRFDWPLELGKCPEAGVDILSLHQRGENESLKDALSRLMCETAVHYKAALPIQNLNELIEGHDWQKADSKNRSFLPHSPDGRWAWYRRLVGRSQRLNFVREGDGSGADQPTLLQWMREPREPNEFAAVLGDPVQHSRTPLEQAEFFRNLGAAVYAIRVTEDEMRDGALEKLRRLGLKWAAVTAPLKGAAFEACAHVTQNARELASVNTIEWRDTHWHGTNTDDEGLRVALEDLSVKNVAVWGGGGTLNVIKKCLPQAQFFSLRTGENREADSEFRNPDTVIWAVGRSRSAANEPPAHWRPALVVDLNYAEDSPGRAFAVERASQYLSGLKMFRAQAEAQRRFWQKKERP